MLEIACYCFPECASVNTLSDRLAAAVAAESAAAQVHQHIISVQEGLARGIRGSSTTLINGRDITEAGAAGAT